jgi:hypothetical protein
MNRTDRRQGFGLNVRRMLRNMKLTSSLYLTFADMNSKDTPRWRYYDLAEQRWSTRHEKWLGKDYTVGNSSFSALMRVRLVTDLKCGV